MLLAGAISAAALVKFGIDVRSKLSTGMTGFDSTWYHGPFAAGFFQSGDTWSLHFIAPQFLAWFYPANAEIFHAAGMLAFGRDVLSPLLNLAWFAGCLGACWCIGRPYKVAPWSLALGAVALSLPVLADQAGEARNDIVGIFFLLAAVAIALNAWSSDRDVDSVRTSRRMPRESANAFLLVGLAAGLAAGTKLNFLLPAAVLVLGFAVSGAGREAPACFGGDPPRRPRRRRLLVPAQPDPHRQPAALVRPHRADLAAGARTGARRTRRAQRARLPDRRLGLVRMAPAGPARRPDDPLAAGRRPRPGGSGALHRPPPTAVEV